MIHGEADNNQGTFPIQSERLFNAIKGHGGTVRFVLLPYESHGYAAKENLLHLLWEQHEWLEKYVKNAGAKPAAGVSKPITVNATQTGGISASDASMVSTTPTDLPQGALYMLDEKEISAEAAAKINPSDIESINVVKDKAAVEKYGDKAVNGVIEIKLKKK